MPSFFDGLKIAERKAKTVRTMSDVWVAKSQYAWKAEQKEANLQRSMAASDESHLDPSSNASGPEYGDSLETLTNKSQDDDEGGPENDEDEPKSDDGDEKGKGKGEGKASEKDKSKRVLVKYASLEIKPGRKSSKTGLTSHEDLSKNAIDRQLKEILRKIRHNIDALRAAGLVESTTTTPKNGNECAFRVLNKTIQINNLLVNNEGNEDTMPILKDFLKFNRKVFGGDIPIEKTKVDPNTYKALSYAMALLGKAYEELGEVDQPSTIDDDELADFNKKHGISFSSNNHRLLDGSDEDDEDEGEPAKKKTKFSSKAMKAKTAATTKRRS